MSPLRRMLLRVHGSRGRRVRSAYGRCEDAESRHHAASVLQLRREHRRRPRRDRAAHRCRRESARLCTATGRHDPHHVDGRAGRERHRPRLVGVRDSRRGCDARQVDADLRQRRRVVDSGRGRSERCEGRQPAYVHLDDGRHSAGLPDRPAARRARSGERHVLSRQRAALRARDSQAARRVRRANRRREFGQVPLRDDAQRLRLHPPGARFAGHRRHRAAPWRRAHGAAARRDDRPHQSGRRQRAVRREVLREQAVRHDPRGHGCQDVLDLAHQQRRVHGREIRRRDARELGRRSPPPSTKRARAVSKPCRVQRSSSSAST